MSDPFAYMIGYMLIVVVICVGLAVYQLRESRKVDEKLARIREEQYEIQRQLRALDAKTH
ncbi:hypothetical protein GCM10011491_26260 [Brucella endophytica]|uniref:Uncharacterized protein n=1 Tax=Brucella endophytica TaxID=1963359 RepID=A0A916WGZ4_9HYPH|nr:hypothetical protein [Brucella endophytica]GGA96672.1 hypothetical protein GCM10011491_26260 [Brucella endophytica]